MKRVIKSYEKMDAPLQALFLKQFPEGVSAGMILTFQDHTGKRFKGVELIDGETMYLIKLDDMLRANFSEGDEKEEPEEEYDREENPDSDSDDDYNDDNFDSVDD